MLRIDGLMIWRLGIRLSMVAKKSGRKEKKTGEQIWHEKRERGDWRMGYKEMRNRWLE